jgi:tetratricopeptide (TPR) repeat protein
MNNLAIVYSKEGRYGDAEALGSQALEIRRRVLGPEHPETLSSMNNLAIVYQYETKYKQAQALFSKASEISLRLRGAEHPFTLDILENLASMYERQGKYALAESYASRALAGRRRALGQEHQDTISAMADLALAYIFERKFGEAEPLARQVVDLERKRWPDDPARFRAETLLGASLGGEKKYAEAEPLLIHGYQGMLARKDRIAAPDRDELDQAREWLMRFYQSWGKTEKAAAWHSKMTLQR